MFFGKMTKLSILFGYWQPWFQHYSQGRSSVPRQDSMNELIIKFWKMKLLVVSLINWCQIQSGISACVMSSEYFMRTSLYLVRLKIFEWIKFLRRRLLQLQENWAGRNFITAWRVNSRLIMHARMQRSIWNLQLATDSTFE